MTTPVFGTDPGNEHATVTLNGEPVDPTTLPGYGTQWTVRDDGLVENLVPGDQLTSPAPSGLQTWVNGENRQTIGVVVVASPAPAVPEIPAPEPEAPASEAPVAAPEAPEASAPAPQPSLTIQKNADGRWEVRAVHATGEVITEAWDSLTHAMHNTWRWVAAHLHL